MGKKQKRKIYWFFLPGPKKSSSIYHLVVLQLARYYMDAKECKKAVTLLEGLSLNSRAGYFHLESDLQQALCLEEMGQYGVGFTKV